MSTKINILLKLKSLALTICAIFWQWSSQFGEQATNIN